MNIILFGPPGIGKSTIIGILKTQGQRAIDLEDFYPNRIRFQIPNLVDNSVIAAADLDPKRSYHNAKRVLLSMDQSSYDKRRKQRDASQPGKASQRQHLLDEWMKSVNYDRVIDVSGSPNHTAQLILAYLKEVGKC